MATNTLGRNVTLPIYNSDGTVFHNLVLKKSTVESVVMSLGDKITGDVYYPNNSLAVTMSEYVKYDGVKYTLISPPTIVREGMVSDNSELKGMTKYSFVFYHPMYMLGNFPFTDIAVTQSEQKYLSQNSTFYWAGNLFEFVAKLNANLANTEWTVETNFVQYEQDGVTVTPQWQKAEKLSDVLTFDKQFISDALKTAYDTWEIPFTITSINRDGKKFLVEFGLPTQEIYGNDRTTPFVFEMGKGVGLKNNSRNPKNNKIITRIAGVGSERNVPFGYPQIPWTGDPTWEYTINNDASAANSYPIYDGIVAGQPTRLIKHPFTRKTLMPSVYVQTVNLKVNPNAVGYKPTTTIIEYYDATAADNYPNPINLLAPSYEHHQFEDVYPRLGDAEIVNIYAYDDKEYLDLQAFRAYINVYIRFSDNENEKAALDNVYNRVEEGRGGELNAIVVGGSYTYKVQGVSHDYEDGSWCNIKYTSDNVNFNRNIYLGTHSPAEYVTWDDTMDDDGKYKQRYFKIKLPQLSFDLYASAAITEEMNINMRSGACMGCTFPVQIDWDDYKRNFYDSNGNFEPSGSQRDLTRYPNSANGQITVIVQKDLDTFGTLMPNTYQRPQSGDKFVILGINLPTSYIAAAEAELDSAAKEYMLENNVHYFDYPLKFDEFFLTTNTAILAQIKNNNIVRFRYAGVLMALYIKQITIKYGDGLLPQYDIVLTDDVEIVLNQVGQVTDDVSRMRVQLSELQKYYSENIIEEIMKKISKTTDDVAEGRISFQKGLDSLESTIFNDEIKSNLYETGLYTGRGWRIDQLGNAEFESVKIRSYLEVVELLVNRMSAQEGDTVYSDNDQIDRVDRIVDETDGSVSYILSLKEKYDGYITGQMYGNVIKGIINTLAAKQAGVSNVQDSQTVEVDGSNTFYTSWMRVINTHNTTGGTLGVNQIQVVLYSDDYYDDGHEGDPAHLHHFTPAGKNFEPCELMTIARWGCIDYSDPSDPNYETIKQSIIRRQRMFMISVTDGRVVKYTGVDSPILQNGNYGVTIGELPEFVKNYSAVHSVLEQVGEHTDWLYAQGIVVGNMIKVDREGIPVPVTVFCGEWVDGTNMQNPTVGNGIYYYNGFNDDTQQNETHEVRHNGGRWQCLQSQPVRQGGVDVFYEPKWNSPYWRLVDGNDNLTIEFVSSKGYSFRRGAVDTVITPHVFYGTVDITDQLAEEYFTWTRESESGKTVQDETWDAQHAQQKTLHLTNNDMPSTWSTQDKAIFTCTVVINDGKATRIVDNQIVS